MKLQQQFIGIDISKNTLDIAILSSNGIISTTINNNRKDINSFTKKYLSGAIVNFVCLENTGKYGWLLIDLLAQTKCNLYVVNPLHLKRSMGLVRGKNDKIDAERIAFFVKKNYEELTPYTPKREAVKMLEVLLSERDFKVKERKKLLVKNQDYKLITNKCILGKLSSSNLKLIRLLDKQIKELENEINQIVSVDENLSKLDSQISSIPGVGKIITWKIIVKTNEFKSIVNPRKMACYAGVSPFENRSGTSVFGKNRVSLYADKDLKRLLHLGAMRAVRLESELKKYYERKVEEGKNKMSVLNAIRNKLIHIIFALVKNNTFYQNKFVLS